MLFRSEHAGDAGEVPWEGQQPQQARSLAPADEVADLELAVVRRLLADVAEQPVDPAPPVRPERGHAGHARLTVDPDRAAPALTLGAAAILGGADPEAFAQRVEQRRAVVLNLDGTAVDREADGQEKLWPQPQVRLALGLVMANPDWSSPSL